MASDGHGRVCSGTDWRRLLTCRPEETLVVGPGFTSRHASPLCRPRRAHRAGPVRHPEPFASLEQPAERRQSPALRLGLGDCLAPPRRPRMRTKPAALGHIAAISLGTAGNHKLVALPQQNPVSLADHSLAIGPFRLGHTMRSWAIGGRFQSTICPAPASWRSLRASCFAAPLLPLRDGTKPPARTTSTPVSALHRIEQLDGTAGKSSVSDLQTRYRWRRWW